MKKLSIEEKARAYDEALKKIKMLLGSGSSCSREELEYVFPELKESEDERIRKKLIAVVELYYGETDEQEKKDCLAWLEKQGEQKLDGTFVNVDAVRDDFINEVYGVLNSENDIGRAIQIIHAFDSLPTLEFEKQGKNNMGISETTKQELKNNLDNALEKETSESWNEFLGEQKSAWSEEDREMRMKVLKYLSTRCNVFEYEEVERWFKSLKERIQPKPIWKPTDEQMKLLREVQQALLGKDCHNRFVNFMYELKRLKDK